MDLTYIKLFRKLSDHPIMDDDKCLKVFIWLLLKVDKATGVRKVGRFALHDRFGYKPSTARDVIYRLRDKYKLIDTTGDNEGTTIRVLNWSKYQFTNFSTTTITTPQRQQTDTIQEYKELKNKTIGEEKLRFSCPMSKIPELKALYPKGHTECIEYVKDIEKDRQHPFLNQAKQYARLHQILEAGYTVEEMDDVIYAMDNHYGRGEWDFDNMANWLEKGGVSSAKKTKTRG